jgi:diguanylate cyclase (GGDEF)-like protein
VLRRAVPFMALALLADLGAALPSGPNEVEPFVYGTILLALVFLSNLLPWPRLPRWMVVLPSCLYVVSASLIIVSVGAAQTGLLPIFLVPILWTSLYQKRWESAVVISAAVLGILGLSIVEHASLVDLIRRVEFWGACGVVIAFAAHGLRSRLGRAVGEREELLRQADALSQAAGRLTSLLQPDAVLSGACRLAAEMASPPGETAKKAQYFQLDANAASGEWEFDQTGSRANAPYPLAEHPYLNEVVRTGQAAFGAYDLDRVGPTLRANLLSSGTTHGAWIPIAPRGQLHGVLAVSSRGVAISEDLFKRVVSLGHIVELALLNALTLERSEREAATDPLTGLSNRRGFDMEAARMRGRRPFAVLAVDVDRLKQVNDTLGHAAGDALLVEIAEAAAGVMRREDLIARIGGDEFAAFLGDASEEGARRAAERILAALLLTKVNGVTPAVSIGVACGSPTSELADVLQEADAAMYSAKRQGGSSFVLADAALPTRLA